MSNYQKAEAIFIAPKCSQCDIYMSPYVERVFMPPNYNQLDYYINRWFCGYCVFHKSDEDPT